MINNIGKTSSMIRLTLGLSIITLFFTQILTGTMGYVLFSAGCVLLVSGVFRTDPLKYMVQKIQSKRY